MTPVNLLILFLIMLLGGCATGKPVVWVEKEASLKGFNNIEVLPVVNKTGKTFEVNIADVITGHIKSILKNKGYEITDTAKDEQNVLLMQTSIIAYEPGNSLKRWAGPGWGKTHCTVRSILQNKKTGETFGEIVVAKEIGEGGLFSIGAENRILRIIAEDIVREIEKLTKNSK